MRTTACLLLIACGAVPDFSADAATPSDLSVPAALADLRQMFPIYSSDWKTSPDFGGECRGTYQDRCTVGGQECCDGTCSPSFTGARCCNGSGGACSSVAECCADGQRYWECQAGKCCVYERSAWRCGS